MGAAGVPRGWTAGLNAGHAVPRAGKQGARGALQLRQLRFGGLKVGVLRKQMYVPIIPT